MGLFTFHDVTVAQVNVLRHLDTEGMSQQALARDANISKQAVFSLEERVARLPGVQAVGMTDNIHLNSLSTQTAGVEVDGIDPPPGQDFHSVDRATVNDGFFDAAGIPIVEGRGFDPSDVLEGEPVTVVSEAFVS